MHTLQRVQWRAARFVTWLPPHYLIHQASQSARMATSVHMQKIAFYKVVNNIFPIPVGQVYPCSHLTRSYNLLKFTRSITRTDSYKYSFLPYTIVSLPFSLRSKQSVESFHDGLQRLTISSSSHFSSIGSGPWLDISPKKNLLCRYTAGKKLPI